MDKRIIFAGLSLLLTACGGINYVGIETCNPGEVTFPKEVKKVLMVNNAVAQPEESGYTYTLLGVKQDTAKAKADSALFDVCSACGKGILDAAYFDDVLLFHDFLQEGKNQLSDLRDQRLDEEQVGDLCEANGADAVISLDKMLFKMDKKVENLGAGFVSGRIKVEMKGIMRAYVPNRDKPLATVLVEDSVEFQQAAESVRILDYYLPSPNDALRLAGDYLGTRVASYFVPHWTEETRWYYNNANSRWKEAAAYATADKWDEAKALWQKLYEKNKDAKIKAKLASNLALACEMENQLDKAYEWAQKAYGSFCETEGDTSKDALLLKAYSDVLKERIESDKKLNTQIGNN